jgi:predicted permease
MHDLRYAVRTLVKSWRVTLLASGAIAIGIGAATAIFSVVNGVLLRPLPYADADRLVMIWSHWENWPQTWVSGAEFGDYSRQLRSLTGVTAFRREALNLTDGDAPERVGATMASASLFKTLGVLPARGRPFVESDDQPGAPRVAVISDGLWRSHFGSDPTVIGRDIHLRDTVVTVLGIMPPGFQMPTQVSAPVDVWMPLALSVEDAADRGGHGLDVVARLAPGVTRATAQREVDALTARFREIDPVEYSLAFGATLVPVPSQVLGTVEPALLLLLGAVGVVLLVACANVANLLLVRAEGRRREMAVRTAVGASVARIARQLLTESLVLATVGGVVGVALGVIGARAFAIVSPQSIPRSTTISVDGRALAFAAFATLLTGILFGSAPVLHGMRTDVQSILRGGSRGSGDRFHRRTREALVVAEVAMSLVLLAGAALLVRSFERLRHVNAGFDPTGVLTMHVSLPPQAYPGHAETQRFYRQVVDRVRTLPGVSAAGIVRALPTTETIGDRGFFVEGMVGGDDKMLHTQGDWQVVSPGYFAAMGIRLERGRTLTDDDRPGFPGAIIFNQSLARKVFGDGEAVGHRIRMGGDTTWRTIVGVVDDIRHAGLDLPPRPELYLPHAQWPTSAGAMPQRAMWLVVRSQSDPAVLSAAVRRELRALDASVPVSEVRTMNEVLARWMAERRLELLVLGALAVAALLLAAIGVYGVSAYAVAQRTHEIGVRVALGARRGDVMRMIVGRGAALALAGAAIGTVAALALGGTIQKLLYGVGSRDPITLVATAAALMATAIAATYLPARRATGIAPIEAMRGE